MSDVALHENHTSSATLRAIGSLEELHAAIATLKGEPGAPAKPSPAVGPETNQTSAADTTHENH